MKKLLLSTLILPIISFADDKLITDKLKNFGIENAEITASPIANLKTVVTEQGVLYASEDGKYFIQGRLVEIKEDGKTIDLSNIPLLNKLKALESEMVIYPAENEKHVITVFFDITCHYCELLHKDIKELNKLGITVRYLAFPRQGISSKAARQMETIFNAKNKHEAIDKSHNPKDIEETRVDKVKKHYDLGIMFGVTGTPAIIMSNGTLIGGYMKPKDLLKYIEESQ